MAERSLSKNVLDAELEARTEDVPIPEADGAEAAALEDDPGEGRWIEGGKQRPSAPSTPRIRRWARQRSELDGDQPESPAPEGERRPALGSLV